MSLSIFKTLQDNHIEYVYIGQFNNKITDSLLSLAELNLQLINESLKVRKRVYFILVEGLQNITRHQTLNANNIDKSGLLIIQRIENTYIITTANYVKKNEIEKIKRHIDTINNLKEKNLKEYYRTILEKQNISSKGGAGLGLIEIARKSNNKLLYDFQKEDEDNYIFFLQTQISNNKNFVNYNNNQYSPNLENIKAVYKKLIQCNILFSISGIFNQDKIVYMLSLLEKRFLHHNSSKNKIFNIIVELLQNIVIHADDYKIHNIEGHYGIFYIAEQNQDLIITTGNYVKKEKIKYIQEQIEAVNSLSIRELTQKHKDFLRLFKTNQTYEKSGLGFINLRTKSQNKINFYFEKVDDKYSFLSIEVKLQKKENSKLPVLKIEATEKTPSVIFIPKETKFIISGKCDPYDARSFFFPIINWLKKYNELPKKYTPITFNFTEINTTCEKEIIKVLEVLQKINNSSIVKIEWIYNDNPQVYELGKKLEEKFSNLEISLKNKE